MAVSNIKRETQFLAWHAIKIRLYIPRVGQERMCRTFHDLWHTLARQPATNHRLRSQLPIKASHRQHTRAKFFTGAGRVWLLVLYGVLQVSKLWQLTTLKSLAPENLYLNDPTVEDKGRFEKCVTIDKMASFLVVAADLIKFSKQKNHELLSTT